MTAHAEGTFHVTSWDEKTWEELGGASKLTRARIVQDYRGDLEGESVWECLMHYREDGTATFTGFARLTGRLDGRAGGFVVRSDGTYDGGEARTSWEVVPGSGSGELRGIRGSGLAVAPHGPDGSWTFDYEVG